jgi:hypothetical protein
MPSLLDRIRSKLKSTKTAEELAAEHVRRATTKSGLDEARAKLKTAQLRRKIAEADAQADLEAARAKLNRAKATQVAASRGKWEERGKRISTIVGGFSKGVGAATKATGVQRRTTKSVNTRRPADDRHLDRIDDLFENPYAYKRGSRRR